ncbi:helix-turn-helix transcriptional regulator [Nocardia sp. NPDC048505]|uniref:helix-turn-helix domain-containing protein n=1 Tax=unclassified Nocardia TaxID=2637762 RepID=UPI0033EE0DF7
MSEHPSAETPQAEPRRLRALPGGREQQAPRADRRPALPAERRPAPGREPLWREALGQRLRALRQEQRETLAETAGRAGVSPQYLSEVERGLKEPSSEMIAAMAGALGRSVGGLIHQVADDLARYRTEPVRTLRPRASAPYNGLLLAA